MSIGAVVVWLLPVVGPFAAPAEASVITTGDVNPGGAATQHDPWMVSWENLQVGIDGSGTLNVTDGGVVSVPSNNLNVGVGHGGEGTLNVMDGGVVSNTRGYIGTGNSDSTGTATITGNGSQWTNRDELFVGHTSPGTLNITDGGVVSNTNGYIGHSSDSTGAATVTGSGSQWNNQTIGHSRFGWLTVGNYGNGTLTVEKGGVVSNINGVIGSGADSTGVATDTGAGSQWNSSSDLTVGRSGSGTLNVTGGGSDLPRTGSGSIGRHPDFLFQLRFRPE